MTGSKRTKTLRQRLFRSHLLVMAVALGVLIVGAGIVFVLLELSGEKVGGRGGSENSDGARPIGLIVGLGAAMIAAGLVSWRVSQRLAEPLNEVRGATRELAAGRYGVRLPGSDTTELDAVADDVNQLAHELQVTEERRLRLIGDVAHELRNPLSTIEGTMEALLDGVLEANDETFARLGREAARLRRLADDLSSLSAAGELGLIDGEAVDLAVIATHVVGQLESQAGAKGLDLRLVAPPVPNVQGEPDRLTQVLVNAVGNALQYTDAGTVSVQLSASDSYVYVDVVDTGRGLRNEDQMRIFERFHRVDGHLTDGTGVGLAIAKLILEAHGGYISATSSGLGSGTTVRIALPVAS